ncbi:MAG: C39 family peptidase [Clostridiales bacterium]|jgi:hypothetical protein|nr:C39 family peptidase [Clostridiales bacterium]
MAIDPATLKMAAKAAFAVLTDEDARRKVAIIAIAPLAAIILLISLFFYILTMPLAALGGFFEGDNLDAVQVARADHGYDQFLDPLEYEDSGDSELSDIVFADGVTDVVYYNQADARWKNEPYGLDTIGAAGCGPTALAMAVSSLSGAIVDPLQMSRWAYANGYKCEGSGSYHSLIPDGARHFGLAVDYASSSDPQKIVNALASGKLIVAIMSKGHFTKNGHFIVLRGVTSDGKILVADPSSRSRSEQEWDLPTILDEARKDAGAGGPFWILE